MPTHISMQELDQIYKDAVGKGGEFLHGEGIQPAAEVGACIATTFGNPQKCGELTKGECAYVNAELKKKTAGHADWSKGKCPI